MPNGKKKLWKEYLRKLKDYNRKMKSYEEDVAEYADSFDIGGETTLDAPKPPVENPPPPPNP